MHVSRCRLCAAILIIMLLSPGFQAAALAGTTEDGRLVEALTADVAPDAGAASSGRRNATQEQSCEEEERALDHARDDLFFAKLKLAAASLIYTPWTFAAALGAVFGAEMQVEMAEAAMMRCLDGV